MSDDATETINMMDWGSFQQQLVDYVRLELAGEQAAEIYPELVFQIATSYECSVAYYSELHRQEMRRPLPARQSVQGRMADVLKTLSLQVNTTEPLIDPNWYEKIIDYGSAWIDRVSQRWRQVTLSLPNLQSGVQTTPALAGFMSADVITAAPAPQILHIAPAGANFEIMLTLEPDPIAAGQVQMEAFVTLLDHFGDFGGVQLMLFWGDIVHSATTDALGKVLFTDLPLDQLSIMRLQINLPS